MKFRFIPFVLTIATLVLSACGAATATATPAASSAKVNAMPVAFVGIVDSVAGDQWVISGTTVTVDASVVRDGPFNAGDRVKVEGLVNPDGSFTISRVEAPTPQETATLPSLADDNSNDTNTNDANSNDGNMNDDNSNGLNSNDDNSNDANINDDNSNSANSNDDNGNSANSNDDNGNDGNSNDDNGGGNSNDDSGHDDNSGGGGNDDSGGDDRGSGGNGNDD